jgi:hypothetical protein
MHHHLEDFVDASFDSKKGAGDGSEWWYVNATTLSWARAK